MKTTMWALAAAMAVGMGSEVMGAEPLKTKGCDTSKKHCVCPCMIAGAEKQVSNTAAGVVITITAQDPAVIKQIQDAAAGAAKCRGRHDCAKGCKCPECASLHKGACPRDCKCPKCADKHKAGPVGNKGKAGQ
ncbi:MAG: hypothetical protein WC881_01605 [Elusimicrobiota bacterium]|jgi:hypothetical protein